MSDFKAQLKTRPTMDQNPYEPPREDGIKPSKSRSTLGGVIRLFAIVVGIMVAIAFYDAFAMWLGTWMSR